ncbi:MAG: TonB-dependent receptor [Hyphomonas sp.]
MVQERASILEPVIVTAERRAQTVQSVPGAISAVTTEQLELQGIDSTASLQFSVPGIFVGEQSTQTAVTIRGVGPTPQGQSGVSSVAVSIDGVNQSRTVAMGFAQADLERIEVARGPQGTLYGRNATGGAINYITKAPTDSFEGELSAGYAEYNEFTGGGVLNVPLGDRVRSRLVVDYKNRQDGFVENIFPGGEDVDATEELAGRLRLAADLTDSLELDLNLSTMRIDHTGNYASQLNSPTPDALAANPILASATFYPGRDRVVNANEINRNEVDYDIASATLTWDLSFATLKSITAYQRFKSQTRADGDGVDLFLSSLTGENTNKTFSQELTLSGATDNLSWVVGAFYSDEDDENEFHIRFTENLEGGGPDSGLDYLQPEYSQKSYAAFADLTYSLSDRIDLIAGLRHTKDKLYAEYSSSFFANNFPNIFSPPPPATIAVVFPVCLATVDEPEFTSTTPRAGLRYTIDDDQMTYFKYSKGYKAGGVNVYSCNNTYEPEEVEAFEVGYKSALFGRSVIFNVAAFHYDYTNFQVAQIVNTTLVTTNASSAIVDGIELEGAWAPDDHWRINASYAYIDARYDEFVNFDGLNPAAGFQDLSGNMLNGAPKHSGNLSVFYTTDDYSWGNLTAGISSSVRSRTYFREFNAKENSQEPFTLANVSLVWNSPNDTYQARLFASNLTDEAYYQSMQADDVIGTRTGYWGPPRQVGVEVTKRF